MSQTTFLESVVSWDHQKCSQNVNEALPKLINYLQNAEVIQEQVGILKIICQLFVPCVAVDQLENRVFYDVVNKGCGTFDCILNTLSQLDKREDVTVLTEKVLNSLELLSDIVDCYETCIKHVGSTDSTVVWKTVMSLPKGTIHVLKGTYGHCKDSSELYGDLLSHVSVPLSALFRKAHGLQMAFLSMLDKLIVDGNITNEGIESICSVCYGLFEVCQIVTSLDVKLVVTLWKAISRHAIQKKEFLKEHLDIDKMIQYLSSEITNGYTYLFQLLPHLDDDGIALSQGDEKGFQKSLKVLGFQMKIMVSLVREYSDFLSVSVPDIYGLIIHLQRMMPPCLNRKAINTQHSEEIRRQLLNATEPLVSYLLGNIKFIESLTCHATYETMSVEDNLPNLLLTVQVIDSVPKLSEKDLQLWLDPVNNPEDRPRYSLLETIFLLTDKSTLEFCLPVFLPGITTSGKKDKNVCLYDEVCVHICGFIGSLPARYFTKLEEVLVANILSVNPVCSQLAADVWCFLVRYGTAELCHVHVKLLLEIMKDIQGHSVQCRNVAVLINRMMKFLAKDHQEDIIKLYPPDSDVQLWVWLSISGFTSTNARDIVETLTNQCVKLLHNFSNTTEKQASHCFSVVSALDVLLNMFTDTAVVEKYLMPETQSTIVTKTTSLINSISDRLIIPLTRLCLAKIIQLLSYNVQSISNKELLDILLLISSSIKQSSDQCLKMSATGFLQQLGKLTVSPSFEQSQILNKIPEVYHGLLTDTSPVIQHVALDSFTHFAQTTVHESIVPEAIKDNTDLQDKVVAFLNKSPSPSTVKREDYLKEMLTDCQEADIVLEEKEVCEPVSKRARTECITAEQQSKLKDLMICCVQGLQKPSDNLPADLLQQLKEARTLITVILDEVG